MVEKRKQAGQSAPKRSLRLWPGITIVVLQLFMRFVVPVFAPEALELSVMGGIFGGLAVVLWWAFLSRAAVSERLAAIALMVLALAATFPLLHESIATAGMGMLYFVYAVPTLSLAFVTWAAFSQTMTKNTRWATMIISIVAGVGIWTLVRTGGFTGDFEQDFAWRWTETAEQRLLARTNNEPMVPLSPAEQNDQEPRWPGFRGPARDGVIHNVKMKTDWTASAPVELWRRPIGPGWSSFAVGNDLIYTQEQRGKDEIVSSYKKRTGEPVWVHRDGARFWEANGGAGPRSTPTLKDGRVYTFGGTGILNVLDALDGTKIWSRDVATETKEKVPQWGFASSPLVLDSIVVVAVSGALAAWDNATGEPVWSGPVGGTSYSSPHLLSPNGIPQILQLNGKGLYSVNPADGSVLWQHAWEGYPIVQPVLADNGDILISVKDRSGLRRIGVTHENGNWAIAERWTSFGLKPYYSDFAVHNGFAFGFDGSFLACVNLNDGKRVWKGGRYGAGQLFLLAEQGVLLVLTEKGDLALVEARSEKFTELARIPAIKSKTWNHPVLVDDILLVRNAREMAAFRLALESE